MRVRALVKNQVMLILVDSGSSHSFVNEEFLLRTRITTTKMKPVQVQPPIGDHLTTDSIVPDMEWWTNGTTFSNNMRVLQMGAYDAILRYDWLSSHSPMICDWKAKTISFDQQGVQVTVKGVSPQPMQLQEISAENLSSGTRGMKYGHWQWSVVLMTSHLHIYLLKCKGYLMNSMISLKTQRRFHLPEFLTIPYLSILMQYQSTPSLIDTHLSIKMRLKGKSKNFWLQVLLFTVPVLLLALFSWYKKRMVVGDFV